MLNFLKNNNKHAGKIITLKIDGMHCTSCSMNIDGELEDLPGVISATTSYANSQTKVEYDPKKVGIKIITQVIEELGYRATVS